MTDCHFFLSSVATWATTGPHRTLTEAIKLMDAEKLSYSIWMVPAAHDAEYTINLFTPQVKGAVCVEFVEFKGGRRANRKAKETA